jgi:flagellar hook-length control protein FliK
VENLSHNETILALKLQKNQQPGHRVENNQNVEIQEVFQNRDFIEIIDNLNFRDPALESQANRPVIEKPGNISEANTSSDSGKILNLQQNKGQNPLTPSQWDDSPDAVDLLRNPGSGNEKTPAFNNHSLNPENIDTVIKELQSGKFETSLTDKNDGNERKPGITELAADPLSKSQLLETGFQVDKPLAISRTELVDRIADIMTNYCKSGENGEKTIEFTISPPNLGKVSVTLQMQEGTLRSTFVCTPENTDTVKNSLPELRQILINSGINLGEATVDTGQQHSQWNQAQHQQLQDNHHAAKQRGPGKETEVIEKPVKIINDSRYNFVI